MLIRKVPLIKICGMTRAEDIHYAAELGVNTIGIICYPNSSRYVSVPKAKQLLRHLPPLMSVVAVLVNPSTALVDEILAELPVNWLQFHGDESPDFCNQFQRPYIKALPVENASSITEAIKNYPDAAGFLLDTPSTTARGGTGQSFDWGLIPSNLDKPFILAGGLNSQNVEQALACCSPYAVDVCSGVEASPGIKDHRKMKAFVDALRGNNHE